MGRVAIKIRVMPEGPESDLEAIKAHIQRKFKPDQIVEQPIGFGLKALVVVIVKPDMTGGTDEIERELAAIEGVSDVQVEEVTLI